MSGRWAGIFYKPRTVSVEITEEKKKRWGQSQHVTMNPKEVGCLCALCVF